MFVALSPTRLNITGQKGETVKLKLELGQTGWQPSGQQARIETAADAPTELLRIEFKTEPIGAPNEKSKASDHSHK
ncbi:MAG TPA: hypothetical protein VJ302_34195 [Blastocatellia bacterium]|nr:hypothetical protein [Blastocatellia bacterium]